MKVCMTYSFSITVRTSKFQDFTQWTRNNKSSISSRIWTSSSKVWLNLDQKVTIQQNMKLQQQSLFFSNSACFFQFSSWSLIRACSVSWTCFDRPSISSHWLLSSKFVLLSTWMKLQDPGWHKHDMYQITQAWYIRKGNTTLTGWSSRIQDLVPPATEHAHQK